VACGGVDEEGGADSKEGATGMTGGAQRGRRSGRGVAVAREGAGQPVEGRCRSVSGASDRSLRG
jgi:hypothetical protein